MLNNQYKENIRELKVLAPEQVNELTEDSYIYFGRETCRYCREFATEFPEIKVPIYYVDTTHTAQDERLQEVRESYQVKTVPTFIFRKKDGSFSKLNRDVRQTISDFIASF